MSERLKRIIELYGESLKTSLQSSKEEIMDYSLWKTFTEKEIIERFSTFDPSRNKSATQWLVTTYLNKDFLLEDLSKAYETLLVFSQVKRLLPVDQRSLNKYKTLASMWKTVEKEGLLNSSPYWVKKTGADRENPTSNEEKKQDKERAYEESILVYQDENLEVVVPLTEFAAKWHGKGTRWCTSADTNNAFHHYNKKAPLIIIKEKQGKSQLWVTKNKIQFMDASDEGIEKLDEEDARIPILKWAASINGEVLEYIPRKSYDYELCLTAVKSNGMAIQHVPKEFKDKEMCLAAVKSNGLALCYVPEKFRNHDLYMTAIQNNGRALYLLPNELCDEETCRAAVKQNGWVLRYIPKELRDRDICMMAVKGDGMALLYVPKNFLDWRTEGSHEMYLAAVKSNGWVLRYIPKELRDRDICMVAVQQCEEALNYVPDELKEEISQYIVKEDISPLWKEDMLFPLKENILFSLKKNKPAQMENESANVVAISV